MNVATDAPLPANEGEDWLYWEPATKTRRRVELLAVPSERARRVRVQHLDADMRAKAEWVPAGRLRVPWPLKDAYLERWDRWQKLHSYEMRGVERDAAWDILNRTVPSHVTDIHGGGGGGILEIADVDELSHACGMPRSVILESEDSLEEEGIWYAAWPTTVAVVVALAHKNPLILVNIVKKEEEELRAGIIDDLMEYSTYFYMSRSEQIAAWQELYCKRTERAAPRRALLLNWADYESPGLADEYRRLSTYSDALASLLLVATAQLRGRRTKVAERLLIQIQTVLTEGPSPISATDPTSAEDGIM